MDLDQLVFIEQSFTSSGYESGLKDGHGRGIRKGRSLGFQEGFKIFEEVGFYEGWIEVMSQVATETKDIERLQAMKSKIQQVYELIDKARDRVQDGEGEEVEWVKVLSFLRSRHKILSGSLTLRLA